MSPPMRETEKTVALQRRLKRSVEKLERMASDFDLLGDYRVMNAPNSSPYSLVLRECGTHAFQGSDESRT
jgi:hypothetical protein